MKQETQQVAQPELVAKLNATRTAVNRMRTAEEAIPHINAIIRYTAASVDQSIGQAKLAKRKEIFSQLYEGVRSGATTEMQLVETLKGVNKTVAAATATLQEQRKALVVKNPDGTEAMHEGKPLTVAAMSTWVDDAEEEVGTAKAELYKLYPKA